MPKTETGKMACGYKTFSYQSFKPFLLPNMLPGSDEAGPAASGAARGPASGSGNAVASGSGRRGNDTGGKKADSGKGKKADSGKGKEAHPDDPIYISD